jgi:transposase, IS6 family
VVQSHLPSSFAGFRFPPEVILLAVRWYLRYGLSYRDLEELLAERGIEVDHVTLFRWVQRFTPLLIDAARPGRHLAGDRWFVDETYVKVAGVWRYVYRAVDQHGQVIDVYVSNHRDIAAARTFFTAALAAHGEPAEVVTDRAAPLAHVIDDLLPGAAHHRAVRQQPGGVRSRAAQGPATTDARSEDEPNGERGDPRPCLRAEPAPRALRTRNRRDTRAPAGHRLRRTPGMHRL